MPDRAPPLQEILARVRAELVDLVGCADGLQATIGEIVTSAPSSFGLDAQIRLQSADALSQRLDRLARLADALEMGVAPDWRLDPAAAGEVLSALKRLGGGAPVDRVPQDEGECELF